MGGYSTADTVVTRSQDEVGEEIRASASTSTSRTRDSEFVKVGLFVFI